MNELEREKEWLQPNTIHEGIIDKRIRQVVDFSKGSDTHGKYACIAASPIVGTYTHATQQMATQCKRSVSTIENWAHAHWLYVELRRDPDYMFQARRLWRLLPASHWWLAHSIQSRGYEAMQYLLKADMHSWSGRDMMREFKTDFEAGTAPMIIKRALFTFRELGDELLATMNGNRAAAAECLAEFERLYEEDGR